MNGIKAFIKELKRVRWPSAKNINSSFWKILLFIFFAAAFLIGVYYVFTAIWDVLGVGAK